MTAQHGKHEAGEGDDVSEIDYGKFADYLLNKRGASSLRDTAEQIGGISASTLSRLEAGNIPDLETFVRVCRWMGVPMETFVIGSTAYDDIGEPESRHKGIVARIWAEHCFDKETASALVTLVDLAYERTNS